MRKARPPLVPNAAARKAAGATHASPATPSFGNAAASTSPAATAARQRSRSAGNRRFKRGEIAGGPQLRPRGFRLGSTPTVRLKLPLLMNTATLPTRHFASDNYAGICPEAWAALAEANAGHVVGYGDDPWTQKACDLIRDVFETHCDVFFVFNGTAANALALATMCQSYHSVLCHELAHAEVAECGAPEFFSNGSKVLLLHGQHAKIDPASIETTVKKRSDIHYPKPRVLSLTQASELGTVYSVNELKALTDTAKRFSLR